MITDSDRVEIRRLIWATLVECHLVQPLPDALVDDDYLRPVFGLQAISQLAEKLPKIKRMESRSKSEFGE